MQSVECPFCNHANPAGAKFCNECGSPLHFAPCKQCDAVNHVNDTQCYRCGALLTSPPTQAEAAHFGPGTEGPAAPGDRFELQIDRLEHELGQIGEEYGEEPGAIAPEPEGLDEAREPAGEKPGAIEHTLGPLDFVPAASGQEAHGPASERPDSSALESRALDMLSGANRKARHYSRAAASRSIPQARLLFSEVADTPRTRWPRYFAGACGVLLVLGIAVGGYHYYRDKLSPDLVLVERGERVKDAPSRDLRTGEMRPSSVASRPPLLKDVPESARAGPLEPVPPVKAIAARNGDEAPKPVPAPPAPSAAPDADSTTAYPAKGAAAAPATDSASVAEPESRCPPAVAAIALCDWIAHADRN